MLMKNYIIILLILFCVVLINNQMNYDAFANTNFITSTPTNGNIAVAEGLIFSPDGTKMYVTDDTGDLIEEYSLSIPWDIQTANHAGSNKDISGQTAKPEDIAFNLNGTKMYVTDRESNYILQYRLSTAYDVSTAAYDGDDERGNVNAKTTNPEDVFFSYNGMKMYVLENANTDTVLEYDLGVAFDVSDETYLRGFNLTSQVAGVDSMEFSTDGTMMFIADATNVSQYALLTAWDVSSSVLMDTFGIKSGPTVTSPKGMAFSTDGTKMFIIEATSTDTIFYYKLDKPWNLFSGVGGGEQVKYKPHIHDEIKVSINSNEISNIEIKNNQITNILANVGDKVDITISIGDDKSLDNISEVKIITNYAKKPSDMNNYFGTNFNDYNQVGLSIYEWKQTKDDITYDYSKLITWDEVMINIQERENPYHAFVGPLLFNEKEMLVTFSMTVNDVMPQSQVGIKVLDFELSELKTILPFTLEFANSKIPSSEESASEESVSEESVPQRKVPQRKVPQRKVSQRK